MNSKRFLQGLLSILLTGALFFSIILPGNATEPTEVPPETCSATEPTETEPVQTDPATKPVETEPPQTDPVTEPTETEPPQTEPATEPTETEPQLTEPATEPTETEPQLTEPATEPTETEPPQTEPATEPTETEPQLTEPATEPVETEPPQTESVEITLDGANVRVEEVTQLLSPPPGDREWNLYFGLLHAHTNISDGLGSVEEAFSQAFQVEGLDFFAVTDHSNSFDNANSGAITLDGRTVSSEWAAGKAAAEAVTGPDFVGIFGYEMTWQEGRNLGHINTFNTPGWQSRSQKQFSSLERYYEALTTSPGSVSQFNHPCPDYGEFENFSHYSAVYDQVINLLEVGGEGDFTAYKYYTMALDKGWHVAPTSSHNEHRGNWAAEEDRTVVLAGALSEQSLYEAMNSRRTYATQDRDLSVYYTLDGNILGSIIPAGKAHQASVWLWDPTDPSGGTVEVITDGGKKAASQKVEFTGQTYTIPVSGGCSYYYLRITQSDGDIAVTAPVWTEEYSDMGITSFTADTAMPVQGDEVTFTLSLFNEETVDFSLSSLSIYANGTLIHTVEDTGTVIAQGHSLSFPCRYDGLGITRFQAEVNGTVMGVSRTYEAEVTLSYRSREMVSGILVDGSHSSVREEQLENLTALASDVHMDVTVFTEQMPQGAEILILPPPEIPYEDVFVEKVGQFAFDGGSVILCGSASPEAADQQNRLLQAVGSTLQLCRDTALDEVHNGGTPDVLYPMDHNPDASWCEAVVEEQFYCHDRGCTVDPGSGTWLVRGFPTTVSSLNGGSAPVLLAGEELPYGGRILASGSFFLSDEAMPLPKNRWDPPRINQSILEHLLGVERTVLPLSTIAQARSAEPGTVCRVKGYLTSGTANKYNTFENTVYLQDDTGGIAVIPFNDPGLQVGTPLEIIGYPEDQRGNLTLMLIDYRVLTEDFYRHVPKTILHREAMDYSRHGGELLQVEGRVTDLTLTEDGLGVSRISLIDSTGHTAVVMIEDYIFSGAYGTNTLASQVQLGRNVRAMGILHLQWDGTSVLRVRNCEEVVWVPPFPKPGDNPHNGDRILPVAATGAGSLAALCLLATAGCRKKRRAG